MTEAAQLLVDEIKTHVRVEYAQLLSTKVGPRVFNTRYDALLRQGKLKQHGVRLFVHVCLTAIQ